MHIALGLKSLYVCSIFARMRAEMIYCLALCSFFSIVNQLVLSNFLLHVCDRAIFFEINALY